MGRWYIVSSFRVKRSSDDVSVKSTKTTCMNATLVNSCYKVKEWATLKTGVISAAWKNSVFSLLAWGEHDVVPYTCPNEVMASTSITMQVWGRTVCISYKTRLRSVAKLRLSYIKSLDNRYLWCGRTARRSDLSMWWVANTLPYPPPDIQVHSVAEWILVHRVVLYLQPAAHTMGVGGLTRS